MEAFQSVHTGEIGTRDHWLWRIADWNQEGVSFLSFDGEVDSGDLVAVQLELASHRMGSHVGNQVEWTCNATDDDGNEYVVTVYKPEGVVPSWSEQEVYSIDEV
jgi:hypothetical protein